MQIKIMKIIGPIINLYKKTNFLSRDFKPKENFLRNKNNNLLTNKDDIVEK